MFKSFDNDGDGKNISLNNMQFILGFVSYDDVKSKLSKLQVNASDQ